MLTLAALVALTVAAGVAIAHALAAWIARRSDAQDHRRAVDAMRRTWSNRYTV